MANAELEPYTEAGNRIQVPTKEAETQPLNSPPLLPESVSPGNQSEKPKPRTAI